MQPVTLCCFTLHIIISHSYAKAQAPHVDYAHWEKSNKRQRGAHPKYFYQQVSGCVPPVAQQLLEAQGCEVHGTEVCELWLHGGNMCISFSLVVCITAFSTL